MISRRGFFGSVFGLVLPTPEEKINKIVAEGMSIETSFNIEQIFGPGLAIYPTEEILPDVDIKIDIEKTKNYPAYELNIKCKEAKKLWKLKND